MRTLAAWETAGTWPFLSVIVINFKRPAETLQCLASLAANGYPGRLEVLLVENGSGDDSPQRLASALAGFGLEGQLLVNAENGGFTGGVHTGWQAARGELVCLLNNDTELAAGALATLVNGLRGRADLAAVWPFDLDFADKGRALTAADWPKGSGTLGVLGANIWLPLIAGPRACFVASGVCLMFPRNLVEQPFPLPYFAYYEDVFFCYSQRLKGLALERVPEAVIYHHGSLASQTSRQFSVRLGMHTEKNRLANVLTLYQPGTLLKLLPLFALDETKKLAIALLRLLRGDASYLRLNLAARWWLLSNLRFLHAQRRSAQAARVLDDAALMRQMSGRMTHEQGRVANLLNGLSLGYCRLIGLRTIESRKP